MLKIDRKTPIFALFTDLRNAFFLCKNQHFIKKYITFFVQKYCHIENKYYLAGIKKGNNRIKIKGKKKMKKAIELNAVVAKRVEILANGCISDHIRCDYRANVVRETEKALCVSFTAEVYGETATFKKMWLPKSMLEVVFMADNKVWFNTKDWFITKKCQEYVQNLINAGFSVKSEMKTFVSRINNVAICDTSMVSYDKETNDTEAKINALPVLEEVAEVNKEEIEENTNNNDKKEEEMKKEEKIRKSEKYCVLIKYNDADGIYLKRFFETKMQAETHFIAIAKDWSTIKSQNIKQMMVGKVLSTGAFRESATLDMSATGRYYMVSKQGRTCSEISRLAKTN